MVNRLMADNEFKPARSCSRCASRLDQAIDYRERRMLERRGCYHETSEK